MSLSQLQKALKKSRENRLQKDLTDGNINQPDVDTTPKIKRHRNFLESVGHVSSAPTMRTLSHQRNHKVVDSVTETQTLPNNPNFAPFSKYDLLNLETTHLCDREVISTTAKQAKASLRNLLRASIWTTHDGRSIKDTLLYKAENDSVGIFMHQKSLIYDDVKAGTTIIQEQSKDINIFDTESPNLNDNNDNDTEQDEVEPIAKAAKNSAWAWSQGRNHESRAPSWSDDSLLLRQEDHDSFQIENTSACDAKTVVTHHDLRKLKQDIIQILYWNLISDHMKESAK